MKTKEKRYINLEKELMESNQKPLYYKFSDYEYNTNSKERILSGIENLDYMIKGFELGCITIWTGQTNAREKYSNDNAY